MKTSALLLGIVSSLPLSCGSVSHQASVAAGEGVAYPQTRRAGDVDTYFSHKVPDPYRWLEDPDSPETRAWVTAQNSITRAWIDAVPEREEIEKRLSKVWNYERYGVPSYTGQRLFYSRNDGLQNQAVWYCAEREPGEGALTAPSREFVLLDPNTLSKDGTISVEGTRASPDAEYFAYALSEAGSDWETIRVRKRSAAAEWKDLDDRVEWVKFSNIAWSADSQGFYYSTFPQHDRTGNVKLEKQELRYHRLGTPQEKDELVYSRPDQPEWGFSGNVTDDGELLVITVSLGTDPRTQVFLKDLTIPKHEVVEFITGFDAEYDAFEKLGSTLYVRTDQGAPTKRVIAIDLGHPERSAWREEVPPDPERTLESVVLTEEALVCTYLEDAHSVVTVQYRMTKSSDALALPGLGSVSAVWGSSKQDLVYFSYSSFSTPGRIYALHTGHPRWYGAPVPGFRLDVWREPKVAFRSADFVTEQLFATSKDGTRLPLFVTRRKDVQPGPNVPCLLYGYGGFDVPIKPDFSPGVLAWMEQGGLYASAVLRGGGEYGRDWHAAGTKERKQNVFDDFIACAEHLIAQHYTSTPKLAISGRSNGGLLVGACLTQRPDLFGAALPGVGVLDMLRYDQFTIGWAWESDYGSASKSEEAFGYLSAYSPLHNIKPGTCYPPTLVTTADHDDRVVPAHSYKFISTLQHAQSCSNPTLIRIDVRAGHGAGKPTSMKIEEWADELAFLWRALGMSSASARP